jgi:hypothetical protein
MKTVRRISAVLLAAAALTACSEEPEEGNAVPSGWIRETYTPADTGYVDSSDPTSRVADEIHGNTSAQDRHSDDGMVFLRYRDDIVAVSPHRTGSLIEIADYRTGYHRWKPRLGNVWPDPDSASFRGGGPGSGK